MYIFTVVYSCGPVHVVRVPIKLCTTCGVYKDLPRCQTVYRGTAEGWHFMMMIVSMEFLTPQVQYFKGTLCWNICSMENENVYYSFL